MPLRFIRFLWSQSLPFLTICLLLFQLAYWNNFWVGFLLIICFFLFVAQWWQEILKRLFGMRQREWITKVLAWGIVFILLSFISAVFVAWYGLGAMATWLVFVLTATISYGIRTLIRRQHGYTSGRVKVSGKGIHFIFQKHWLLLVVYAVLWFAALFFLINSRSDAALLSPWQAMSSYFLPLIFLLSVVLGILLYSKFSIKVLLFLVLAHGLLVHLYMPLSHTLPWGGDVWRHVAMEQRLLDDKPIAPVLFGEHAATKEIGPFAIPEVLVTPQKYIYSQLWGISTLLSRTLDVSLITINIWLIPIVWSFLLPIIFFRIGGLLFRSWRRGLVFAALANAFFPLQALGGLTLPVSLGYVSFFLVLFFWLCYLRTKNSMQKNIALFFGVLMLFGYPLHAVVFWFIVAVSFLLSFSEMRYAKVRHFFAKKYIRPAYRGLILLASIVFFPLIELVSKISRLPQQSDWLHSIKQMIGIFSGWFFASAIRPHDMLPGNILFNHVPENAYVPSFFLQWRWFFIPAMLLTLGAAIYGLAIAQKNKYQQLWSVLSALALSLGFGYVMSWFYLEGDHLFARRMDALLAFCLLIFSYYAFVQYREVFSSRLWLRRATTFVLIICISWVGTASYASGPDMRVVSKAEFDAAAYIWQEEEKSAHNNCVIGDTWTLLVLEGLSGRKIVGGGFPIDYQFGQPALSRIYTEMNVSPTSSLFTESHELTKDETCWVVLPQMHVGQDVKHVIESLTGAEAQEVGSLYLWREQDLPEEDVEG